MFQKFDERRNDIIEFVLTLLFSDIFDKDLKRWLDPFVSYIVILWKRFHGFSKDKVFVHSKLIFWDILDQETIGIVPGQEDFFDNSFDSFLWKVEVISFDKRWIDEI